jgi:hypothetical protein
MTKDRSFELLKIIFTSALSGTFAAYLTLLATNIQVKKEIVLEKTKYIINKENVMREKTETFFIDTVKLINQLEKDGDIKSKNIRPLIENARISAFRLAAHSNPQIASRALALVESINIGVTPTPNITMTEKSELVMKSSNEMIKGFFDELERLKQETFKELNSI